MMTPLFSFALTTHPPAIISFYQERYQIYSTSDLGQIEKALETLDSDSLVLFDVDSTLIVPDDAILRPSNEDFLEELLGGNIVQNLPTGPRYIFREILLNALHSLVDKGSISCVQNLQEKGIPVIAFTAAPRGKVGKVASVADFRIEELKRFGFDFSSAFAEKGVVELPKDPDKEFSPLFKSGILFASLHPKGDTLQKFLHAVGWTPNRVVLIDDQLEYVQSVGKALETFGIPYTGFHYTAAEKIPYNLNREVAQFQVRSFLEQSKWINDFQAKEQLHLKPVIYFDFGGVIAQPDNQIQLTYLAETLGFPTEALRDSPYLRWMQLHSTEIDYLKRKSEEHQI